jgi:hypothetical protein
MARAVAERRTQATTRLWPPQRGQVHLQVLRSVPAALGGPGRAARGAREGVAVGIVEQELRLGHLRGPPPSIGDEGCEARVSAQGREIPVGFHAPRRLRGEAVFEGVTQQRQRLVATP